MFRWQVARSCREILSLPDIPAQAGIPFLKRRKRDPGFRRDDEAGKPPTYTKHHAGVDRDPSAFSP
jgi:hypothetical protein